MKTLVYFASGKYKEHYQELPFENIYLIDRCFSRNYDNKPEIECIGKVKCVGMDCLHSINYLKSEEIKIDYFVVLNEGLYEGGGQYALNSDMFLGYLMPILNNSYYHLMNPSYYSGNYKTGMDLPFKKVEIKESSSKYLPYYLFSQDEYHKGRVKIFLMSKKRKEIPRDLCENIKISVIHDSIWCDYDALDGVFVSIKDQGQGDFFYQLPKTHCINLSTEITDILNVCYEQRLLKVGITPWKFGNYKLTIKALREWNKDFPKEINFYHLNKKDFGQIIR